MLTYASLAAAVVAMMVLGGVSIEHAWSGSGLTPMQSSDDGGRSTYWSGGFSSSEFYAYDPPLDAATKTPPLEIRAFERERTNADVLPAQFYRDLLTLEDPAQGQASAGASGSVGHLVFDESRLLLRTAGGLVFYGIPSTTGGLCYLLVDAHGHDVAMGCDLYLHHGVSLNIAREDGGDSVIFGFADATISRVRVLVGADTLEGEMGENAFVATTPAPIQNISGITVATNSGAVEIPLG
jgi:hypothetical protein